MTENVQIDETAGTDVNDALVTEYTSESDTAVAGEAAAQRPRATAPGAATGRRKQAVARVRIVPGTGEWTLNGRTPEEYLKRETLVMQAFHPPVVTNLVGKFGVVARVKPHTSYNGPIESGWMKMMMIGLGKHVGAAWYHRVLLENVYDGVVRSVGRVMRAKAPIAFGLATVENAYDDTALIDAACGLSVFMKRQKPSRIATLDLRIDYLKPATPPLDVRARAECYKLTRQIAFVRALAYHDDPEAGIAAAAGTFIIFDDGRSPVRMVRSTVVELLEGAPPADRSSVVGTFTAFADVGFAIGAVSLGAVADVADYEGVFLAAAAASVAGLFVRARMPRSGAVRTAVAP